MTFRYKKEFVDALLSADRIRAKGIVNGAIMNGISHTVVVEDIVVSALLDIGNLCDKGMVALSQIYISGLIGEEFIDSLLPKSKEKSRKGRIVIGVLGDFHALGKKIVSAYLRASGLEVIDIGNGLQPEKFTEKAHELKADIIAISVLMLHSALQIRKIRDTRDAMEVDGNKMFKILVGGAPFNFDPVLYKTVGADATARNASKAVIAAKELIQNEFV